MIQWVLMLLMSHKLCLMDHMQEQGLIIEAKENQTDTLLCLYPMFDHQKPCDHRNDTGLSLFLPLIHLISFLIHHRFCIFLSIELKNPSYFAQ